MMYVRLILVISKLYNLNSKAIDFVLAFPHADLEEDIWTYPPIGFQVNGHNEASSDRSFLLKLNKKLYGLKKGSYNRYKKLKKSLVERCVKLSVIDPCLYIGNGMIILTYFDDCIIVGPSMKNINRFLDSMKNGDENSVLIDEGNIHKFLGIEITQLDDKIFKISQLYLTDQIISFLNIDANDHNVDTNLESTPVGKPFLCKDLSVKPRKETWNYGTAVGMMTYLQGNSQPDPVS